MMNLANFILELPLNRFFVIFSFEHLEFTSLYSDIIVAERLDVVLGIIWMKFAGSYCRITNNLGMNYHYSSKKSPKTFFFEAKIQTVQVSKTIFRLWG